MSDRPHGKGPAEEPEEDKFPEGMRVLAVDDDPVCLRVLEALLRICKYKPTTVTDGRTALDMLREGGEDQFDLVITDLHMPDMDGFKLLELIGLEMDLPVIMLSVNGEKETMYQGIVHGACDYLVKPVNIKELRNIWQHVVRNNHLIANYSSSDSDDAATGKHGKGRAKKGKKKCSKKGKKRKNGGRGSHENKGGPRVKKPRVTWTGDLHNRFLDVVNQLGVDRAVPKRILRLMNVKNLSRESVASHLQKYRLFLKRFAEEPEKYSHLVDSYDEMDANPCPEQPAPAVCRCALNKPCSAPSILGPHGLSIQRRNTSRSLPRNAVHWQPDTSCRRRAPGPPVSSSMLDALHPHRSDKAYVGFLREKLLEASGALPAGGNAVEGEEMLPVRLPVRRRVRDPWQCAWPSNFPLPPLAPSSSQVNTLHMNHQPPNFGASPGQMAMFQNAQQQNQISNNNNNDANTPMGAFSEHRMTPLFNMASSQGPAEMMINGGGTGSTGTTFLNLGTGSSTQMVDGGRTSSPFPNHGTGSSTQMVDGGGTSSPFPNHGTGSSASPDIPTDSSAAPMQGLNDGGDASAGVLPPVEDGPAYQHAPDDQPTYSSNSFLEQILTSMDNQDFSPGDALFGGEEY